MNSGVAILLKFLMFSIQSEISRILQEPLLYPATTEHPTQTQLIAEDQIVGFWHQVKQSGAMCKPEKQDLAERVEKLLQAVKQAREEANTRDETPVHGSIGGKIFDYLFEA